MKDITCLLIDDDPDEEEIFGTALQEVDTTYQFVTAKNGIDALEKLNVDDTVAPDFIFLDLNMPFMNGKEFLREIKKNSHLRHIPVIIYTTSSHMKDIEETKQLGASHFLIKPSSISKLTQILSRFFQKQFGSAFSLDQEN